MIWFWLTINKVSVYVAQHALVLGVHAVHMNERLGNLVHPGCVFGHPSVEQEVDVANPSGAVSPEGRKLRSEPALAA